MIRMKLEDHLDGATNFISWKSRVLISEENDLLKLVNEKVRELDVEEDKSHWRKSDARARRILVDSVSDHLVSQISQYAPSSLRIICYMELVSQIASP